jgi:hypothetical protein
MKKTIGPIKGAYRITKAQMALEVSSMGRLRNFNNAMIARSNVMRPRPSTGRSEMKEASSN